MPKQFSNLVAFTALEDDATLGIVTLHGVSLYDTNTGSVSALESSFGELLGWYFGTPGAEYLPENDTLYWIGSYSLERYNVSTGVSDTVRTPYISNIDPFYFLPDGRHIVTGHFEIIDTQSLDQYSRSLLIGEFESLGWFRLKHISFNAEQSQALISGTQRSLVGLYDISSFEKPKLQISWDGVDAAFSPAGSLLAVANLANGVVFYDSLTRERTGELIVENKQIEKIFFSPSGCSLLAVSSEGELISIAVPEE
jgi:hypothetical protein